MRPALSYQAYNERTYVTFQSQSKRSFRIKQKLILNDPSANIQFFQEKTVRYIGFENLITRSQASYEYPPTATVTHYSTNSTPTTLFFQRGKKLDRQEEICQIKNYEKQEPIQARFKPVFLHNTEERNPQHNPFPITTSILK